MNHLRATLVSACLLAAPTAILAGEGDDHGMKPHVKIATNRGDIVLELNGEKAPVSTWNFIQYTEDDFYDGTTFHRVMKNFMIQAGGFTEDYEQKTEGLRPPILNEWQNGLKNERGTIAMARLGGDPNSATSQFFINVVDNANLDAPQRDGAGYAVFGQVVEGMDVVDEIRNTAVTSHPKLPAFRGAVPAETIVIQEVSVVGQFDREAIKTRAGDAQQAIRAQREKAEEAVQEAMAEMTKKAEKESEAKAVTTSSGLVYVDFKVGEGETPGPTDNVEVHYTGWLPDGSKFDSSVDRGQPFKFSLRGGVIQGWLEGVGSMKVGGKRRLIIPPDLGYGAPGRPPVIPPSSVLVFDVELLDVMNPNRQE